MSTVVGGFSPVIRTASPATSQSMTGGVYYAGSTPSAPVRSRGWLRYILQRAGGVGSAAVGFVVPDSPSQLVFTAGAGQFTVDWTAPAANADGSTLDLTSYNVYWGTTEGEQKPGGAYTDVASVAAGTVTKTVTGLAAGTWFVAVTAINDAGESSTSPETSGTVT